ncbi:glycerol dehydratase reactivase beta/small subunit family protein [Anaerospora hongkongensis]|nr:glycerol dehydratase reactivase beta/small subunit family protein [Anaerospora hongkongensis]
MERRDTMQAGQTVTKPSITLCVHIHEGCEQKLREIQAGIEEEGVPCTVLPETEPDCIALACKGASLSQLGVGIGISSSGLCIHHHKLPANEPLFVLQGTGNGSEWRRFGYNAARLIKGIPFKNEDPSPAATGEPDLTRVVREIVLKILKETAQTMGR